MIGRIYTAGRPGFNSTLVTVEADILSGIPSLTIVGLPDHAVRESRERIRSAIVNAGFVFPARQIIINLSPNDTPKEGGLMEAAMAAAVLVATGQLPQEKFRDTALLGSLSLDGSLHTARGIAAAAVFATQQPQVKGLIIPQTSASEVATADSKPLYAIRHLNDLTAFAYGQIDARQGHGYEADEEFPEIGFEHIFGLAPAKRALAIAAVGRHHMLMVGSPGTGKSLLARAYRYLLPPLSFDEAAEVTRIYSLAGLSSGELVRSRPFRAPHHTTSTPALVGGSTQARPGEISLAHRGTLFLDELPEFRNEALQSLREPLEDKKITIARARGHLTYPADFQLIAAANPCRCGDLFSQTRPCSCGKNSLAQFSKLVGPFLDRIAIELNLNQLNDTFCRDTAYSTQDLRSQIIEARTHGSRRNHGVLNEQLDAQRLYAFCAHIRPLQLFEQFAAVERLTMRTWLNTLRVALSIADMDMTEISEVHVHEALQYHFLRKRIEQIRARAA